MRPKAGIPLPNVSRLIDGIGYTNDNDNCRCSWIARISKLKRYKTHRTRLSSEGIPRGVIKSRGIFNWIVYSVDLMSIIVHSISIMSRASKIFLGGSIVVSGAVIYGVHWIQKYESDVRPLHLLLLLPTSSIPLRASWQLDNVSRSHPRRDSSTRESSCP